MRLPELTGFLAFRFMFGGQRYVSQWDLLHNGSKDLLPHGPRLAYGPCTPMQPTHSCSVDPAGYINGLYRLHKAGTKGATWAEVSTRSQPDPRAGSVGWVDSAGQCAHCTFTKSLPSRLANHFSCCASPYNSRSYFNRGGVRIRWRTS